MSISSARLLAHLCCTCLLLLSVTIITTANPTRVTPTAAGVALENRSSQFDLSWKKDKCQFNLTDSGQPLEARSSTYQRLGFSQCEYIIQAPNSRFLLLNFTDIHSQSDMPEETGVRHQHFQQAATETTTTTKESIFAKAPLEKPLTPEKVNSTTFHFDRGELLSTTVDVRGDTHSSYSSNLHKNSKHNTSLSHSGSNSNSITREPVKNITLSEDHIHEHVISKDSIANSKKHSDGSLSTEEDNNLKLTTDADLSDVNIQTESRVPNCSLKLIIEEIKSPSGSKPQVICWEKSWEHRIPLVFQYSVPIRITYVWDRSSQSGFSLDVRFLRPEEVDCLFRCNSYLCLPKKQLCDGYNDCPDHSDEHSSTCALARQQQESGEPQVINVIVVIISVILGVIIVLVLIFMISHIRGRHGACRGGDSLLQPPHSQSSEVCRSPSGSMQESGQYEALLHQHPQRSTPVQSLMVSSSHCLEHQQLLHQQHHETEVEPHQQHHQHVRRSRHFSQVHQLCPLNSEAEAAVSPDTSMVTAPLHRSQQLLTCHEQRHSEQHLQQHRKQKQSRKHVNPDELYPPNIPLSADGEEGYARSQKALHSKQQLERNWQMENEVFRPPPNKTVYDRDSPPPPYSLKPPGTKLLDSHFPSVGVVCVLRQARSSFTPQESPTEVPRCHSMSCHY